MQAIVERLIAFGEFEVEVFGDDVTLHKPIAEWPVVDVLLSWHSDGFPLDKVRAVSTRQAAGECACLIMRRQPPVPTHPSPGQIALDKLWSHPRWQAAYVYAVIGGSN